MLFRSCRGRRLGDPGTGKLRTAYPAGQIRWRAVTRPDRKIRRHCSLTRPSRPESGDRCQPQGREAILGGFDAKLRMAQISMVRAFLGASFGSETGKSSTGAGFQSLFNSTHPSSLSAVPSSAPIVIDSAIMQAADLKRISNETHEYSQARPFGFEIGRAHV